MKRYVIFVVAFLAAALFIRLGIWQLDRLSVRRSLNSERRERLRSPPLDLTALAPAGPVDSLRFRRAVGGGVYDFEHEVVVMARSYRGVPGVHLVTPLVMPLGDAVLVERGWVAAPDGKTVQLEALREDDSVRVEGVLLEVPVDVTGRALERTWPQYARRPDPTTLQPRFSYPLRPFVLRRTTVPESAPSVLRAVPLPDLSDGPHLWYAIQWFAFAIIAVVGSVALYRKSKWERGDGDTNAGSGERPRLSS